MSLLPLPPGWTEHVGPQGQLYYHHSQSKQSTYTRPSLDIPTKDKPLHKKPIPGTDYQRVTTTQGKTFYYNKSTKQSLWTVPPEIADAVASLQQEEHRQVQEDEDKRELDRVRAQVSDLVKRKANDIPGNTAKKQRLEDPDADDDESGEEEEWQKEAAAQLAKEAEVEKKRKAAEDARLNAAEAKRRAEEAARVDLSIDEAKALFKASSSFFSSTVSAN